MPRADSRAVRVSVARGNMPYSPVTQPLPEPFRNCGTPSSTVAVQITRVRPISISTLPSAVGMKSGVSLTGRIWSAVRPSVRNIPPVGKSGMTLDQFDGWVRRCQLAWSRNAATHLCFGAGLRGLGASRLARRAQAAVGGVDSYLRIVTPPGVSAGSWVGLVGVMGSRPARKEPPKR